MARPPTYQSDAERPITVSVRIPPDLYAQAKHYGSLRRMTFTELLLDGLRLRLDTPADPRDILVSQDNTVIQQLQEMVDAAVHHALEGERAWRSPPTAVLAEGLGLEDDAALPAPEAFAPLPQSEPRAAPHAPADPSPPAAGMKWCQKGLHQYPATKAACRQCATLRQQKHRANKAKEQGGEVPAL